MLRPSAGKQVRRLLDHGLKPSAQGQFLGGWKRLGGMTSPRLRHSPGHGGGVRAFGRRPPSAGSRGRPERWLSWVLPWQPAPCGAPLHTVGRMSLLLHVCVTPPWIGRGLSSLILPLEPPCFRPFWKLWLAEEWVNGAIGRCCLGGRWRGRGGLGRQPRDSEGTWSPKVPQKPESPFLPTNPIPWGLCQCPLESFFKGNPQYLPVRDLGCGDKLPSSCLPGCVVTRRWVDPTLLPS